MYFCLRLFFHSPSSDFSLEAEKKWALIVGSAMKVDRIGLGGGAYAEEQVWLPRG